jgi:hypothetical protein
MSWKNFSGKSFSSTFGQPVSWSVVAENRSHEKIVSISSKSVWNLKKIIIGHFNIFHIRIRITFIRIRCRVWTTAAFAIWVRFRFRFFNFSFNVSLCFNLILFVFFITNKSMRSIWRSFICLFNRVISKISMNLYIGSVIFHWSKIPYFILMRTPLSLYKTNENCDN